MIVPFLANADQNLLDDLKNRIGNTRWPEDITDQGWDYGTNLPYLRELANYWQHGFDWRKTEAEINAYPNFIADIDGYKIHFLHIRGAGTKSIPLIITHGWPGSFLEMMKLIPLLNADADISFDLVIPSVIGFGFSNKATQAGCSSSLIADLWHKLMMELGYKQYAVQGGDIGAGIGTWLALNYPQHVIGLHLNYIPGSFTPYPGNEPLSPEVVAYKRLAAAWGAKEAGYIALQSTKPVTLAYGLNDSPIGLCAWILEKFNSWSDNGGNIEQIFSKDELLSNITLYWITGTIYSSVRIYRENAKMPLSFGKNDFVKVPVGFARFPKEIPTPPRSYVEKGYNIRRWTEMPAGGHFAAMEQPVLLAKELKAFFASIG